MDQYIENIVRQYFKSEEWVVHTGASGMNNTTKFLTVKDKVGVSQKYVIRIYESHQDRDKIIFEHTVLEALKERKPSFLIPQVLHTLSGETIAVASDGKLVSLAVCIEGKNPELKLKEQCYSLGKIVGEITKEFGQIKVSREPSYGAYYNLEASYPECPLDQVIAFFNQPPEGFNQAKLRGLGTYFIAFQTMIPMLKALPHQLSHGDINASNVLQGDDGDICAVLDFEFATQDLRVIDLAVCLSEMINRVEDERVLLENMTSFIEGYLEYMVLSDEEIQVLPDLLILRRLDVLVHFLARYQQGISNEHLSAEEILKKQIDKGIIICDWVRENREYINSTVRGLNKAAK